MKNKMLKLSVFAFTALLVVELNAQTIEHNGYTYKTVKSPHTGKIWLDRNLGAERKCKRSTDELCYGDYYQWGRDADGHQNPKSKTTDENADDTTYVGHGKFILGVEDFEYDWALFADKKGNIRKNNWNPCPSGFRVPTIDELKKETIDQGGRGPYKCLSNIFASPLIGHPYR